ncbi:MAG: metal dependent amidohydrolase superfamily protein [Phenylobacterium sp.]|jgi:predicted amidohydrolase YtcJ|nr:metal dependent amidohydrolase superfamily protein [Phenylobacterium sp.]
MRPIIATAALALVALPAAAAPPPKADLVIWGGPIYTAVDARPTAQAVAVTKGRISFVGGKAGAQARVGPQTRVIDLHGAALFPGFTDSHAHLRGIGERELTLNLEGCASAADVAQRLKAYIAERHPAGVVIGRGWIETGWPEHRFLQRGDIDAVSPELPALLERADGHALVANSAALKAAGITAQTQAPEGGQILKGPDGQPTGMLVDNAMALVRRLQPGKTRADKLEAYRAAFRVETAYGWTGVHNMSVDWLDVPLLEDLAAKGEASLRVYNAVEADQAGPLLEGGPRSAADGRITTRDIKLYMDGALGSRGAALFEPYSDAPGNRGTFITQPEHMRPILARALSKGIQVSTHAIGDKGNATALDLYAEAFKADPARGKAARWRIEHAQIVRPADIPRFGRMGVIASMQPSHAIGDFHFAPARLGEARLKGAYAWQSLLKSGAVVVGGSDAPVERGSPMIEFYAAVARKDLKGFSAPDWHPEETLSRQQALKLFTASAAYARFAENDLGTLTVGKRADLSAFSVNLMTAPVAEIPKAHAVLTVVDGQVVYAAN